MSYAIRKDGLGWRAVNGPEDIGQDEVFSEAQPSVVSPPVGEVDYIAAIQSKLDATARQYGYDSILSAVTYADDPTVPLFQHQGQAFRAWRSQIWAWGYALLAQVKSGAVQQPTVAELVAQMPSITVPTA